MTSEFYIWVTRSPDLKEKAKEHLPTLECRETFFKELDKMQEAISKNRKLREERTL